MTNDAFFEKYFGGFWSSVDRSRTRADSNSMFGDPEIFDWLIHVIKPQTVLELGSWKGHSANHMADICKKEGLNSRVLCVDTFLGAPEHWVLPEFYAQLFRFNGMPTVIESFLGNVIARKNDGVIFPMCIDSRGAAEVLKHENFRADLIFVDAAHGYPEVIDDIMNFYPLLSDQGVMFGDDYQHEPLARAVHDCAEKLGVQVIVGARKWIFANEAYVRRTGLAKFQLRKSFAGWVHP